ncbi:hypothetical protein SEA_SIXAMA_76 [Gordonia phage Sixama]|uniref:Uncharacterized protein n=1 Tax=Gordonia phage Sixama TaxID=2653271 RepID=A0A5Q2F728_9CAUD|nr:hypothetical protein PP302_gp076 [Gordonia phage Sixama]QGF20255.1 hypothetical protein SEA_SIXAMA_76 [Gordonia phage Sixama]
MSIMIPHRWLSDTHKVIGQVAEAYEYPDYSGPKSGPGRVADLYDQGHWFAKIWTNDFDGADVMADQNESENLTLLVFVGLLLRKANHDGVAATKAFDDVVSRYQATVEPVSELSSVLDGETNGQ